MCDGDVCERKPVGPKVVHTGTAAIDASAVAAVAPTAATEGGGSDEGGSSETDESAAADTAPGEDELPGDLKEEEGKGSGVVAEQEEDPGVAQLVNNVLCFSHAAIALWCAERIANEA